MSCYTEQWLWRVLQTENDRNKGHYTTEEMNHNGALSVIDLTSCWL